MTAAAASLLLSIVDALFPRGLDQLDGGAGTRHPKIYSIFASANSFALTSA